MKRLFFLLIICFCAIISHAQVRNAPFTPEQTRRLDTAAKRLIEEYARSIKHLTKAPANQIGIIADNIVDFFIKGAKVQVTTVHNGSKKYDLREYLTDIVPSYKEKFEDVIISFTRISIDGTHLQQKKDGNGNVYYVGDFSYTQQFCVRYKNSLPETDENSPTYWKFCEQTQKTGKFIITRQFSPADGNIWEIRLGDILVKNIQQTKP
ncbi:hypothetical protein [Mucilaginibacter flavidus]|uniref:hypothetical protein n=1 Tax=Mucilaginibacter flavidus TaxID=2949309 RepID=UPI002093C86D|nr:hypothetical protein [Mucilaginibacter flavidus]MCO5945377.1 hypothetical protein [Mucilaginibacter flavidus]